MKDQHTKIKGYRDLSQQEIDAMNSIKDAGIDQVFLATGKADIQKGLAMVIRSIAQPSTFC